MLKISTPRCAAVVKKLPAILPLACLFSALCLLQASAQDGELVYEKYVLDNGLTVILHRDSYVPIVTVNVRYAVGAKNEEEGMHGFAHLFEHYMHEGSEHSPKGQFWHNTQGCGGYANANTTQDRTDYFVTAPSECLEEVFRLESDRMGFLEGVLNKESLDKQRGIVENEKRLGENTAYGSVDDEMAKLLWDKHPYSWGVIGEFEDLRRATVETVKRFHAAYYNPNNAVLAVAGDIDPPRTLELIKKWFGTLPAGAAPPKLTAPDPGPLTARREKIVKDPKAQYPVLVMAYRIPGQGTPKWEQLYVLAAILGGGRTSRLVQSLQREQQIVVQIGAGVDGLQEADKLEIVAYPARGVSLEKVEEAIHVEIDRLIKQGVTQDEMDRIKAGFPLYRLEELQSSSVLAGELTEGMGMFRNPDADYMQMQRIERMDRSAVQEAAKTYLGRTRVAIVKVPTQGENP